HHMPSERLLGFAFLIAFWMIAWYGWRLNAQGRIDSNQKSYLYLMTAVLTFSTASVLLGALHWDSSLDVLIGIVVLALAVLQFSQILIAFGWGSRKRGLVVLAIFLMIAAYLYHQQQ